MVIRRVRLIVTGVVTAVVLIACVCVDRVGAQPTTSLTAAAPLSPRVAALIAPVQEARDGGERARAILTLGENITKELREDPAIFAAFVTCAEDKEPAVRAEVARTMGQIWIWESKVQKPEAIEVAKKLARDSDPDVVHNAVYFCLSTAQPKTDDVIRAMFDAAANAADYDPVNLHGRIAWGLEKQSPRRVATLCEPYWAKLGGGDGGGDGGAANEKSAYLIYKLYVQITGQEPPRAERFAAIKAKAAEQEAAQKAEAAARVPAIAREIAEGDSTRRMQAMQEIYRTKFMWLVLDERVLDAMFKAADDPSPRVRGEIARVSGNRWVWGAEQQQNLKAIDLALKLRKDPDWNVRHYAVYFGLSTVRDPSDEVIKALVDSGMSETDGNTSGRAAWGLTKVPADRLAPFFQPYFDEGGDRAMRAAQLFTQATGGPPPRPPKAQADDVAAKSYASAFKALFDHLADVYPAIEAKKLDWPKIRDDLVPKAAAVKDDREFGLLCLRLVVRLEDSHAQLLPGSAPLPTIDFPKYDPGFACLIDDRDRPVVYHVDSNSPAAQAGVKVGMTVVSVNGTPAADAVKAWMDRQRDLIGYSSERYLRYDAAKGFHRAMKQGEVVKVEMESLDGQKRVLEMPATLGVRYVPRLPVPIDGIRDDGGVMATRLDDNIGYIYVRRIRGDLPGDLDAALKQLGDIKGLIIDVRGNSGGGFDASRAFRNFDPNDKAEPDRPRYTGRIALLIDERCISAGEGWASWFFANRRARAFGTTTAGASSRKAEYTLTNGLYKVIVPVKAYTGSLDRPIERRGLEPDVPVRARAADLAAGTDTVLETAKAWLRETK